MGFWTYGFDPHNSAADRFERGPFWVTPEAAPCGISHEDWLASDLPWVASADAVLRLPGASKGADMETQFAEENGIPVFAGATDDLGLEVLCKWFASMDQAASEETEGGKEPYEADGEWMWFHEVSGSPVFHADDINTLPLDVWSRLRGGESYSTREAAVEAYADALYGHVGITEPETSGERREYATGSVRDSRTGKGRFDLLPPAALRRLARHFERGAEKYGDRNWERGQPLQDYIDSAFRHIANHQEGMRDEDHLIAAAWNLLAHVETETRITRGELPASLDNFPAHRLQGGVA